MPSFTLRIARSEIPLVSDRRGVDVQWFQERSSQSVGEIHENVSVNDFMIPIGLQKFCKLLWVSCEVLVLQGYVWIHWVVKSWTTTAFWWLFRESHLSLRTLWSAVFKSPKFSARSTCQSVCFVTFSCSHFVHLNRENTSFEVWYLHTSVGYSGPPSVDRRQLLTIHLQKSKWIQGNHALKNCSKYL